MQGIVLLGGYGSRLNLFTRRVSNKALALVYNRLVFEYPLNTLVRAGITDITLIVGCRYAGNLVNVIGDGKEFGINNLNYVYQKEAGGISQAIYLAKKHITKKCAVILGDNFFEMEILDKVSSFEKSDKGCGLFLKEVSDPERYGVAEFTKTPDNIHIYNIEEKPKVPKTNNAVTGLYFYDQTLFDKIENLKPSARGELEVTDLNMMYIKKDNCVGYGVEGFWNDMGTYESILETANFVKNKNFNLSYNINAWDK